MRSTQFGKIVNMKPSSLPGGTVHELPKDLGSALKADKSAVEKWTSLTPLARNEWICWVISPKLDETRVKRLSRTITELNEGMRRPCCWIGCIHRTDKEISPSVRGVLGLKDASRQS